MKWKGLIIFVLMVCFHMQPVHAQSTQEISLGTTVPMSHKVQLDVGNHGVVKTKEREFRNNKNIIEVNRLEQVTYVINADPVWEIKSVYYGLEGKQKLVTLKDNVFVAPAVYEDGNILTVTYKQKSLDNSSGDQSNNGQTNQNGNADSNQNNNGQTNQNGNTDGNQNNNGQTNQNGNADSNQNNNGQTNQNGNTDGNQNNNGQTNQNGNTDSNQSNNGQDNNTSDNHNNTDNSVLERNQVKTGDDTYIFVWFVSMIVAGMIIFGIQRQKHNK